MKRNYIKLAATAALGMSALLGMASSSYAVTRGCGFTTVALQSNKPGVVLYEHKGTKTGSAATVFLARRAASKNILSAGLSGTTTAEMRSWFNTPTDIFGVKKKISIKVTGNNGCYGEGSVSKQY